MLLKVKKLLRLLNPLSGFTFPFGINGMRLCRPKCDPLRLKPTD